ncbi:hypothetical protein HC031_05085 [Planosporangium thailandense]|uniref:WXG100 family type VII secretion target n=1 Tax=Planosporangium thailandense TaxID=765197 RepID=A0ABX0XUZ2_9ACTN|nr:hypothetical protein [Planosporangium thailandense]NJC69099.1 hypothetical protein [Planosporangium thailandense]
MTLKVQPSYLDGYAAQLGRGADDATSVKRYLDQYRTDGNLNGPLIELAGTAQIRAMSTAAEAAAKAARILHDSQEGLARAATYYRTADVAAAARADATLPGRCAGALTALEKEWAANECAPSFSDSREPSGRLKPVDDVKYTHPLSFMDDISISNWMLKGFDFVFGFNPLDKASEFFIGDWQAVAKGGVAIGRAADALHDLGYNVQGGAIALRGGWTGVAAGAAYQHFTGLAGGIDDLVNPIREISKQFDSIAHGVYSVSEAVTGWLKGIADAAIIAGIAAAAGTVTAETGVGAVVGYGVATVEVCEMLNMWADATAAMSKVYGFVQGAVGAIDALLPMLQNASFPNLSGYNAYSNPLAIGPQVAS